MRWLYKFPLRLRSLFRRGGVEQELTEELRFHIQNLMDEKVAKGMTPEEARYAALRELGSVEQIKEECRDMRRVNYIENFVQDIRYGLRMLAKNPGFTAVAVITLSLGIGANTTIFSLADALLFRPFPVAEPGRLVTFLRQSVDEPGILQFLFTSGLSGFPRAGQGLSGLAAYSSVSTSTTLNGEASRIDGEIVSGNYFSVLGVKPALGRTFLPEEDQAAGLHPVIVLSADFWHHRLNSDPGIIGKTLTLNGHSFTVLGVAPAGFRGLYVGSSPAFWVPLAMHEQVMPSFTFEGHSLFYARGCDWLDFVGRLKPGRTVAEAQAEAKTLAGREAAAYPEERKGWTVAAASLTEMRLIALERRYDQIHGLC